MPRGGRGRGRGRGGRGGRRVGKPPGRPPGRPRRGGRNASTYQPRKRPWETEESDSEEFVVTDNESDDYDDDYYSSPRAGTSRRALPAVRQQRIILDDIALEEEDDEVPNSNCDGGDLEVCRSEYAGSSNDDDEFVVDISDSDDAASDASSMQPRRPGRPPCARVSTEPVRCVWMEDRPALPPLELPESSQDLLLPNEFLLRALEVYEICRRFGAIVKLSPFLFEDFCACLASRDQNPLLDEIHVALLRCLLKDDESTQVTFGPADVRDSVNISIHLLDHYTYGELTRRYVESDERFPDYAKVLGALTGTNYPFVDVDNRLTVLTWLSRQFLSTQAVRTDLAGEGVIEHEDHCRDCGKLGDLLCCDTCPAVYHMNCCNPPVEEPPSSGWQCEICTLHDVKGVSDCRTDVEKIGQLIRQETLGYDRHGRRYAFLVRRLFVEDESSGAVFYYSSLVQIRQLFSLLDGQDLERELCREVALVGNLIIDQTSITDELTEERFQMVQKNSTFQKAPYLSFDKSNRLVGVELGFEDQRNGDADDSNDQSSTIRQVIRKMDVIVADTHVLLEECDPSTPSSSSTATPANKMTRSRTGSLPKSRLVLDPSGNDFVLKDETANTVQNGSPCGLSEKDEQVANVKNMQHPYLYFDPGPYFKLGEDREFMRYNNQYTSNPLSKSPYLRAEERNRSKYMCNRFLMDDEGEFTWPFDLATSPEHVIRMLKSSIMNAANRIPSALVHPGLSGKEAFPIWKASLLNSARSATQIAACLATYESHIRPVVFSETYRYNLGHSKFYRLTAEDKEERQRKEKMRRKDASQLTERCLADPTDETSSLVWVKYSLLDGPPKHQIWKQRDEAYRVNGDGRLGGWLWTRKGRSMRWVEAGTAEPMWECAHGPIIDELLMEVQYGYHCDESHMEKEADEEKSFPDDVFLGTSSYNGFPGAAPLCAELPMEFDDDTATFEVNRAKALSHLGLAHHVDSIDVSLGLIQHSIYYKVAKRSKCLDRFLLYRLKQEDDEDHKQRIAEEKWTSLEDVTHREVCYSADCRIGSRSCYSPDCRRADIERKAAVNETTSYAHKLKVPFATQTEKSDSTSWQTWMKDDSVSVPPSPKVLTFGRRNLRQEASRNILVLPSHAVKKLGRKAGIQESVEGFNHTAKASAQVWPYPCFRPTFQTCWRYNLQRARSLHAVALLFRILYHNIRWDQVCVNKELDAKYMRKFDKYSELRIVCGHRLLPPYGLKIRYRVKLIRASNALLASKISTGAREYAVSSGDSNEEEEFDDDTVKSTRQKAPWSLRERKAPRSKRLKNFEKTDRWIDDDALMLWEMKNYWFRRQRGDRLLQQAQWQNLNSSGTKISGAVGRASLASHILANGRVQRSAGSVYKNIASKPPVLQAEVTNEANTESSVPTLTIPMPAPNTSIVVDVGGGQLLLVSNKPQAAGGPCVFAVEALPPGSTVVAPQQAQSSPAEDQPAAFVNEHMYGSTSTGTAPKTRPKRRGAGRRRARVASEYGSDEELFEAGFEHSGTDRPESTVQFIQDSLSDDSEWMEGPPRLDSPEYLEKPATRRRSNGRSRSRRTVSFLDRNPPDWGTMNREEKKRYQDVKSVMSRVIEQVAGEDRGSQRYESKNQGKSRIQYWRDYRLKRKQERMKSSAIDHRMEAWEKEITKRRKLTKSVIGAKIRCHFTDNILEKVVAERTLLGWPEPNRPFKRVFPPPLSPQSLPARDARSPAAKRPRLASPSASTDKRAKLDNRVNGMQKVAREEITVNSQSPDEVVASANDVQQHDYQSQPKVESPTGRHRQEQEGVEKELYCVCRTPFDSTKFYVMCDLCGRWFHGKCVGITARKSKHMTSWSCYECQKAKEVATQELYCVCQTPYDESKPYVCCDSCDGWFHCDCVGISPAEADKIPSFICPKCAPNTEDEKRPKTEDAPASPPGISTVSTITKRLEERDYQLLGMLIKWLREHQMSWPFRSNVDRCKHPLYSRIIKNHIDLNVIETKAKLRQYLTLADFSRDVANIFNNARTYYPVDSPEFQCATVLDQYFTKELRDVKLAIAASVAENQRNVAMNWNGKAI